MKNSLQELVRRTCGRGNTVFNSSSISSFEFADGTVLSSDELLARGFDIEGTANDETANTWREAA